MTEASHQITSNPHPPLPHRAGSVGLPGTNIDLHILTSTNDPVSPGNEGEICIRSPSITSGYLSNPAANASSFTPDGFFRTGDYGKLDENGYLYLTGRIKEFINKGGEKISPVEVDNLIAAHPAVADVVTFAMEDEMYGQEVGAAVILKEGDGVTERELKKWVRERVAPLKVPKKACSVFFRFWMCVCGGRKADSFGWQIWFPDEIPKTATGKVQRAKVAEAMTRKG
ncbi:MAG: hypothetical protein Q9171_007370 [Xanthocarpia ochracea]